jgi:hypothetical protein
MGGLMKKIILSVILLLGVLSPFLHSQDIFSFDTYDYSTLLHIKSYHPAAPNGAAVILVPGGMPGSSNTYYLQPPEAHPDYPVFINNLTDMGYIVVMPYSEDSVSLYDWKNFLDFTINITANNPRITKTIVVAHSAGGMVTLLYFADRTNATRNAIQDRVNDVVNFNSPLVFSDIWTNYCGSDYCNKINTKFTLIFSKGDWIMSETAKCDGDQPWYSITQQDAIDYCDAQKNPKIKIITIEPGYGHSPFGDNNGNVALPLFFLQDNSADPCATDLTGWLRVHPPALIPPNMYSDTPLICSASLEANQCDYAYIDFEWYKNGVLIQNNSKVPCCTGSSCSPCRCNITFPYGGTKNAGDVITCKVRGSILSNMVGYLIAGPSSCIRSAVIASTLTQSVTPTSGMVYTGVTPTFVCGYYENSSGNPISGATVRVVIDSTYLQYAVYSPSTGDYRYSGLTFIAGNHSWYCIASKVGYIPQIGTSRNYTVQVVPTRLGISSSPSYQQVYGSAFKFYADYSNMSSSPIENATVRIYIDNIPFDTVYTNGLYSYTTNSLTAGQHTWYATVEKPGYVSLNESFFYIMVVLPSSLTQSASPPSPQYPNTIITFSASYLNASGAPIPNSEVRVCLDNYICYDATYDGNHYIYNTSLGPGVHSWYFDAVNTYYQPQTAPNQTYVINAAPPLAALKGGPDGYLYIPNASKIDPTNHTTISYLKIEKWCNMSDTDCQTIGSPPRQICGCNRTWCDQAGGTNPYYTKTNAPAFWRGADWPNGRVRVDDTLFIAQAFGSNEGDIALPRGANWSYMADCVLTGGEGKKVRVTDVLQTSSTFGADGTYSSNTTNIRVKFNNNPNFFTPNANGYVQIPSGAANFIVYNGTKPVMALVTFYNTSAGVAAAQAKQPAGMAAPTAEMPIGDSWTAIIVLIAISGLVIGYFVVREAMSLSIPKKRKKR